MKKNMWKLFFVGALVSLLASCSTEEENTNDTQPTLEVQTGEIIVNCGNMAVTSLTIKNNSAFDIEEQGILYSKQSELDITNSNKLDVAVEEDGSAKILIEDLETGTVYYYCSFAKSNGDIVFGETKHFTTSSQAWKRETDYETNFNSDDCMKDFTAIKLAGDGRPWHVVPIKVKGLPDYVLASSSIDVRNAFTGKLIQTKDADNILQYTADFTGKTLPAVSIYAIDIDAFLVGVNCNSTLEVLVSPTPITTLAEASAAEKIGTFQFTSSDWQTSKEFLLPLKYSNTKCYIAIHNNAVFEKSIGVLMVEFVTSSLVDPNK